jgi:glyoxylase-like metal-dependent hydrolase (beta-lactamase superfamily II)
VRGAVSPTYTLHAIPVGRLPIPGWEAFFGINDHTFYDLGFYVWVVTDGTSLGLIDTGLPPDPADRAALDEANRQLDERSTFTDVRTLVEALHESGIAADDVDFVAITQTITYHTGGLDAETLPRAQIYLSRAGIQEMLGEPPGHPPTAYYFTDRSWASIRTFAVEGRLHCVDEPTTIVPGIRFETTGGHHPGSAGLRIDTDDGVLGLLETAFLDRNVSQAHPIGIAEDVAACRTAIRDYRRTCDRVVALHDPANAQRFPISVLQRQGEIR